MVLFFVDKREAKTVGSASCERFSAPTLKMLCSRTQNPVKQQIYAHCSTNVSDEYKGINIEIRTLETLAIVNVNFNFCSELWTESNI